ncbi:MAG: hypothetical protein IMZ51_03790 [Chloroflexi bacterium]|nr:hypothetical protein [Chloroflexota bacterium]
MTKLKTINEKLTKSELNEIDMLISYYSSLDLDIGSEEEAPHAERDILNGLIKLRNLVK